MSVTSKSIPIRRHDELEDIRPDAHHEVVTTADIDARIDSHSKVPHAHHEVVTRADVLADIDTHNGLTSVHPTATSIGGRNIGFHDNDIAVLPTGTVGQILRRGLHQWEAFTQPEAAGGDFVLVSEANITSPHTTVFFGGLDINAVGGYCLLMNLLHNATHTMVYGLTINNDTVSGNYRTQTLRAFSTSVGGARASSYWAWESHAEGRRALFILAYVGLVNQDLHVISFASERMPTQARVNLASIRHINAQSNITSIRVHAGGTGGIDIGSILRLYRL